MASDNIKGFTLIEVIISLILLGVMVAVGGLGLVDVVKGYRFSASNAEITQKIQPVLLRLNKEFIEFIEFNGTATKTGASLVHTDGVHSIAYDADYERITINNEALIDGVTDFQITYISNSTSKSTWQATDDIRELSGVELSLSIAHPHLENKPLKFLTRVSPRNNNNLGGAPPDSEPPTMPDYGCFVVTAACGNPDHPLVSIFRNFRDSFLQSNQIGRALIRYYYEHGPDWARWLQNHPLCMPFIQFALMTVAGYLLLLQHKILTVICAMLGVFMIYVWRHRRVVDSAKSSGSALMGIIFSLVIVSLLVVGLVPIFSSSTMETVYSLEGLRAYYVAESGYRYAAKKFLDADSEEEKMETLENMDVSNETLGDDDGWFELVIFPYWFEVTKSPGNSLSLKTKTYGQVSPWIDFSKEGRLYHYNSGEFKEFSKANAGSNEVVFYCNSAWSDVSDGDMVTFAAEADKQTVYEDGSLKLKEFYSYFPEFNGAFSVESDNVKTQYSYRKREGDTLYGIELVDTTSEWKNISVKDNDNIILEKFLRLRSTGHYASATREILYNIPIGWIVSGDFERVEFIDTFDDLTHWYTGDNETIGSFGIAEVDGSKAMDIETVKDPTETDVFFGLIKIRWSDYWGAIFLNWKNLKTNLAQSWSDAKGYLSYDVQMKTSTSDDQKYFMSGMLLRTRGNDDDSDLDSYGVSFLRAMQRKHWFFGWSDWYYYDDINDGIKPPEGIFFAGRIEGIDYTFSKYRYSQPAIVLWQRNNGEFSWLAYKILDDSTDNINTNGLPEFRLKDWSSILVRLREGTTLEFTNGTNEIQAGDIIVGASSNAQARVVDTPIITAGEGWDGSYQGKLVINKTSDNNFDVGESLLVQGTPVAEAGSHNVTKTNYFKVYYCGTEKSGTPNGVQTDLKRKGQPRDSVYWPPDDVQDSSATNDYFTLVQWDGVNTGASLIASKLEPRAIVKTSALSSPTYPLASGAKFDELVGLVVGGYNGNEIYFDDFGIQLDVKSGSGFLPPIQQ